MKWSWTDRKNAVCIYSQLKRVSSSEASAIIQGVLSHCTEMEIDRQYVDSHGQSAAAFAFCRLLKFGVAVLCLHLLQTSLVYINTRMIQEVLADPQWLERMATRDLAALSPLLTQHIYPYGRFELDLESLLPIEEVAYA
jgi:TnpA family transposase